MISTTHGVKQQKWEGQHTQRWI